MSLIYDNPYNNNIANSLINLQKLKEYNNQPTRFNYSGSGISNIGERVIGGMVEINKDNRLDKSVFYTKPSSGGEYIQPGTNSSYPQYNAVELNNINNSKNTGGSMFSTIASIAKPFVKPLISKGLDLAVPALTKKITGDNLVGDAVSSGIRDLTSSMTGYGRDLSAGVGNYETSTIAKKYAGAKSGGKKCCGGKIKRVTNKNNKLDLLTNVISNLELDKPTQPIKESKKKNVKSEKQASLVLERAERVEPSKPTKNIKNRMELVKKIMAEKKLNLPQASKYIKEAGLY
jgi:hypothetical protein